MTEGSSDNISNTGRFSRVLVVDDDERSLSAIRLVLEQYGFAHEGALDGITALDKVRSWRPDIILLDVMMPGIDGIEVCKQIKEDPSLRHIPVISLTANSDRETKMRCLDAGASDFLIKPIDYPELTMKVLNHLRLREFENLRKNNELMIASVTTSESARKEMESLFSFHKSVLDSMKDGVAIVDTRNYRIMSVNSTLVRETGRQEHEIIGRTCYEVLHGDDEICEPPDCPCPIKEVLATRRHFTVEHLHHDALGNEMYVEITASPVFDDAGSITQIVHVSRNVTERKFMEHEIRKAHQESELRHAELSEMFKRVEYAKEEWEGTMDCISDIVMFVGEDDRIIRCNNALKQYAQCGYAELIGRNWQEVIIGWRLENNQNSCSQLEVHKPIIDRWFTINAYPFKGGKLHQSTGQVITVRDTTDIKNLTRSLELTNSSIDQERGELKDALEQLSHLIQRVMDTKDLSIRYPNTQLRKCWEVMKCGKTSCPCYAKESMRCWQVAGTFCGGKISGQFAEKFGNCSNCPVYGSATSVAMLTIGEHFNNMMHMLDDKNKELQGAYRDLQSAQSQVIQQEKMASIGQLAAGVAHEINNPTGFIMSNLETLRKYADKLTEFIRIEGEAMADLPAVRAEVLASQRKALKVDFIMDDLRNLVKESLDGADRIKKIVQDLKSFSRVDEAEQKMADVNAGIESTINIVWNELKYKATVKKEYGDIPLIKCNPGQLNQVFMNILVNAAHAIEKQGEIRIRTWAENNALNVSIADTGSGIPKDKINRIFEPFFTTKEVGKGTGLGLSIAYDIVKKHKGAIAVESEIGKGTTFIVTIPITVPAAA